MDGNWNSNISSANLLSLISDSLSDNKFSYSDTLDILTSAAFDGFSQTEIEDLKYMYSQDLFASEYVKNITYNVIFTNEANKYWWGGTKEIDNLVTLGNASSNTSQTQANLLIDKWFLGKDLPMPISGGDTANPAASSGKYDYGTITGDLFTNGITALDVNQGSAGTCYLIASMESIAALNPSIIENAFIDNKNETYGVRFFYNGEPIYVTVNKDIPITSWGSIAYAGNKTKDLSGEAWASLLEKAYVQANAQVNLKYKGDWTNSATTEYHNSYKLLEGGLAYTLGQLSGDSYDLFAYGNWSWPGDYNTLTKEKDPSKIKQTLIDALEQGGIGWIASWGASYRGNGQLLTSKQSGSKQELVAGHAFALHGYDADTDTFIISNPWTESSAWSSYNTTFKLPIDFFWSSHFDPLIGITNPKTVSTDFTYNIATNSASADTALREGNLIEVTITRDSAGQESTVYVSTAHQSTSSGDFVELSKKSITFERDELVKTIEISTLVDNLSEETESFALNLYKGQASVTADASASSYIKNVDNTSYVYSLSSNGSEVMDTVIEGSDIILTITRDDSGSASTVYLSTNNLTASSDDVGQLVYHPIQFLAKETFKTINLSTYEDAKDEGLETVEFQLYDGPAQLTPIASKTISIKDAWSPEFNYLIYSDASSEENAVSEGSKITFNVIRSGSGSASTAYLKTFFNNAMSTDLVDANNLELHFAANETIKTFTVTVTEDLWLETTESFGYYVYNSETTDTPDSKGIAFIKDKVFDEFEYTLSSNNSTNLSVDEGSSFNLNITRDGDGSASEVYISTRHGTTTSSDYDTVDKQKITFNQKDTVKTVEIQTFGDDVEDDEIFWIDLYLNENDLDPAYSIKVNLNDVQKTQDFDYQVSNVVINEGDAANFTITRDGSGEASTVWVATSHASADGNDYEVLELTSLTFSAKETEKSLSINTFQDSSIEGAEPEYFWLDLYKDKSDYQNGDYAAYGYADIIDISAQNTPSYTYSISNESDDTVAEGGDAKFTITRSASGSLSTIYLKTIDGTADASDYESLPITEVIFNEKEITKTVSINTYTDSISENSEYFYIELYDSVSDANAGAYNTWHYSYIADGSGSDSVAYTYSVDSVNVAEGETATFTITRDGSGTSSTVYVNTSEYTADQSDLNFLNAQTVTFAEGETSKSVSIDTYTDGVEEGDEYFYLDVFASQVDAQDGSNYIAWGEGTITDDNSSDDDAYTYYTLASPRIASNTDQVKTPGTTFYGHDGSEFQNAYAFAVLKSDGTLDIWGDVNNGGDASSVSSNLSSVEAIYSNQKSFAAQKTDGSVIVWGNPDAGGDLGAAASKLNGEIDVTNVASTKSAYAALREDGSVVTWGSPGAGGNFTEAESRNDIVKLYSNSNAFAALSSAGEIITWGQSAFGGDGNPTGQVASEIFIDIFSTASAFAAIKSDGSVFTWGNAIDGGDSSLVAEELNGAVDITSISSTTSAFAALKSDGSVVTWGNFSSGGNSSSISSDLDGKVSVSEIFSTDYAFAALRSDGSVITWGDPVMGGNTSSISNALNGDNPVTSIYANSTSFLAIHQDSTITTWGLSMYGGDSSSVTEHFNSGKTINEVAVGQTSYAVLFDDGNFVTWGDFSDDDSTRIESLTQTTNAQTISANHSALYAIDQTGAIIAWGDLSEGGNYSVQEGNNHTFTSKTVTRSGNALSDVTLTYNIEGSESNYSTVDGENSIQISASSSGTLTAEFTYSPDIKAITSQDALETLRLSVGMTTQSGTSSAFDFIAADFNRDGKVTSADALSILKYSVGLPTEEQATWKFLDPSANYSDINRLNTNTSEGINFENLSTDTEVIMTGILIGDVNDSYSSAIA